MWIILNINNSQATSKRQSIKKEERNEGTVINNYENNKIFIIKFQFNFFSKFSVFHFFFKN